MSVACWHLRRHVQLLKVEQQARLQQRHMQVFEHNNVEELEKVLRASIAEGQPRVRRPWKKILVVVEGIYSMEGEMVPLLEVAALCKRYKVSTSPDEATPGLRLACWAKLSWVRVSCMCSEHLVLVRVLKLVCV